MKVSKSSRDAAFQCFYGPYPRKIGKGAAEKAFPKAVKDLMDESGMNEIQAHTFLADKAEDYAEAVNGQDPRYIPHPATWLNQKRYHDDPEAWQDTNGSQEPFLDPSGYVE